MFGFGKKKQVEPFGGKDGSFDKAATSLAQTLISSGIDGVATFDSADEVAERALAKYGSREAATDAVVRSHIKLVGVSGFITNLGGFVTLPVALPANVVGFYLLATRMVAAIAKIHGQNLQEESVRSAVLLDLIGTDATQVLKGVGSSAGMATNAATRRLPPAALVVVNKAVAFRIGSRMGTRFLTKVPRLIPVAGGAIGAGLDVMLLRKIADAARRDFAAGRPAA